jgi:hypothetical protein
MTFDGFEFLPGGKLGEQKSKRLRTAGCQRKLSAFQPFSPPCFFLS